MTSKDKEVASVDYTIMLTFIFVILKLTNSIDWSWWWVLSPLWLPLVLVLTVLALTAIFVLIFKK